VNFRGKSSSKTKVDGIKAAPTPVTALEQMFCESTLWSIGCHEHLQNTTHPTCLVEMASCRPASIEDMNREGAMGISEDQTPASKQHQRKSWKPQTTAKRQFFQFGTFFPLFNASTPV
ncbi:hypothetical protein DNTS_034075, partial [Danionella cerebrum]